MLTLLKSHLHDSMTQTVHLSISAVTPLLSPGNGVTHSEGLIRAVVVLAQLPLGAFEDDTVCVACACVYVFHVPLCVS